MISLFLLYRSLLRVRRRRKVSSCGVTSAALPNQALQEYHCQIKLYKSIIAKSSFTRVSLPNQALQEYHCQIKLYKSIIAKSSFTRVSLPNQALQEYHCQIKLYKSIIAKSSFTRVSLPNQVLQEYHCNIKLYKSSTAKPALEDTLVFEGTVNRNSLCSACLTDVRRGRVCHAYKMLEVASASLELRCD